MREISYQALVIPTKVGIQYFWLLRRFWIPASAGMTVIFATLHRWQDTSAAWIRDLALVSILVWKSVLDCTVRHTLFAGSGSLSEICQTLHPGFPVAEDGRQQAHQVCVLIFCFWSTRLCPAGHECLPQRIWASQTSCFGINIMFLNKKQYSHAFSRRSHRLLWRSLQAAKLTKDEN